MGGGGGMDPHAAPRVPHITGSPRFCPRLRHAEGGTRGGLWRAVTLREGHVSGCGGPSGMLSQSIRVRGITGAEADRCIDTMLEREMVSQQHRTLLQQVKQNPPESPRIALNALPRPKPSPESPRIALNALPQPKTSPESPRIALNAPPQPQALALITSGSGPPAACGLDPGAALRRGAGR